MFKYVAYCWRTSDPAQRDFVDASSRRLLTSPEWATAADSDGLRVLCAGARAGCWEPYVLDGRAGVILGSLFSYDVAARSPTVPNVLSASDTQRIVETGGRRLIERYWGRYVAFVRDRHADATFALADPMGGIACYYAIASGVHVFFSDIAICQRLGMGPFSIDWREVRVSLITGQPPSCGATALEGVASLQAGECMQVGVEGTRHSFYWNPFAVAATDVVEDIPTAVDRLRQTAKYCIGAWAHGHRSVLHRLSGGIDSNIVLACLRDANSHPRITCVNYHSPGSDTDERSLARAGAARANCELVERRRNSSLKFDGIFDIAPSPVPEFYVGYLENFRLEAELAASCGATAVFDGGSGDGVFLQSRPLLTVGDYVHRHGVRPALLQLAYDVARMTGISFWTVLRRGLRDGFSRSAPPLTDWRTVRKFVHQDAFEGLGPISLHTWFRNVCNVPQGKHWHALLMTVPLGFYNPYGQEDDPDYIHPIQSQPLVELCLRIPTYILTARGWGRYVARCAFAEDVPHEIIWRRTKGGLQEHMQDLLSLNLKLIRETVLDGALARRGLIHVADVEAYLSGRPIEPHKIGGALAEVLEFLCLEVWINKMSRTEWATAVAA